MDRHNVSQALTFLISSTKCLFLFSGRSICGQSVEQLAYEMNAAADSGASEQLTVTET